ncbi:MAG: glycine cleavage T C-terminal barrel domain-containing protein, partial [Gammaproteobacteria bacterium]|nr:glycine cleavage T C-terminal barrel domain-containing protein [Gammaproteobacteria bacterium]
LELWDELAAAGADFGLKPLGTHALEIARIEAGFLLSDVDFVPADRAIRPDRTRSPFELDLAWLVDFKKPHFNGRRALLAEQARGSRYRLVRLVVEGNKIAKDAFVYDRTRRNVGVVTSATWSPALKASIALASIEARSEGELRVDIYYQKELRWSRKMALCREVDGPFFAPERRRRTPAGDC